LSALAWHFGAGQIFKLTLHNEKTAEFVNKVNAMEIKKINWFFAVFSIIVFSLFTLRIVLSFPEYFSSLSRNYNPDAIEYGVLANNMLQNGCFSRNEDCAPDPLRTPGYPAVIIASMGLYYPILLYSFQILMFASIVWSLTEVARRMSGGVASFFAGLVLTLDSTWYALSLSAMSEIAGVFFSLHGLLLLGWPDRICTHQRKWSLASGALMLGIAILIRPSYALYPIGLLVIQMPTLRVMKIGGISRLIIFLMIVAYALPGLWVARNYFVFGIPKLSTVSTHNLIYFVGAGAFQVAEGIDRQEAQKRISEEFGITPYINLQNPYSVANVSTIEKMETDAESKKWKVLGKHAVYLIPSTVIAICKAFTAHPLPELAYVFGTEWDSPGMKGLATLQPSAYGKLFGHSMDLVVIFFLHLVWIGLFLVLLIAGVWKAFLRRSAEDWSLMVFFCLGLLTISLFGIDAVYRSRIVATVPGCLLCGFGGAMILDSFGKSRTKMNR
jgi:hypothetical protein